MKFFTLFQLILDPKSGSSFREKITSNKTIQEKIETIMKTAELENQNMHFSENPFESPQGYVPIAAEADNSQEQEPKVMIRSRRWLRLLISVSCPSTIAATIMIIAASFQEILLRGDLSTTGEALVNFIPVVILFSLIGAIYNCVPIVIYTIVMEFLVRRLNNRFFIIGISGILGFLSGAWLNFEIGLCGGLTGLIMGSILYKLDDVRVSTPIENKT